MAKLSTDDIDPGDVAVTYLGTRVDGAELDGDHIVPLGADDATWLVPVCNVVEVIKPDGRVLRGDPPALTYETPGPGPVRFHPATIAAAVSCAVGWFASVILISGLRPFVTAANAVAIGLVILGLIRPRAARGERAAQAIVLVTAGVGLFL
jgi:hypothetical protein